MPNFKHKQTNEVREWRTDNEDIFQRLHKLGWRQVEDEPVEETVLSVEPEEETEALPDTIAPLLEGTEFDTLAKVQAATDDQLLEIDGIGQATLKRIREATA